MLSVTQYAANYGYVLCLLLAHELLGGHVSRVTHYAILQRSFYIAESKNPTACVQRAAPGLHMSPPASVWDVAAAASSYVDYMISHRS